MPYSKISAEDKDRLYQTYVRGEDYVHAAEVMGIKRTTAYHIVRRAEGRQGVVTLPRGGKRIVKITDQMKAVIVDIVNTHPDFSLKAINAELRVRLPLERHVSTTSISNVLKGQLITLKKLEDAPTERNSNLTKQRRRDYAAWLMQNVQRYDFIYVDEAGINIWTKRTRGRARRGERAVRVVQGRRGQNLTMTFAVSAQGGLIYHELFQGGMTAPRFNTFLESVANAYAPQSEVCFVFDNASAHGHANTANLPHGYSLQYLPPYSPFLNICENAFATWKQALKVSLAEVRHQILQQPHAQNMATLAQLAEQDIRVVTAAAMTNSFRHMQAYVPDCFAMVDILM